MSEDEVTITNCTAYSNKPTIDELIADLEDAAIKFYNIPTPGNRNQLIDLRAALRAAVAAKDAEIARLKDGRRRLLLRGR